MQLKGERGRPAEPKNNEQQKEGTNNNIGETKKKQTNEVTEDSSYSASLSNQENQALSLTPKEAEKVGNSDVNMVEKSIAMVDTLDMYEVKPELIDILRKVVSVHGDIFQNSTISTIKYRSMYLEVIGDMIIELQETNFAETDDDRLQDMMVILDDMKHKKVDVEWLQQKLADILEARQGFKHSMMLKEERECNIKFIKNVEQELKEKEEEIEAMKAKLQSLHDEMSVCKKKLDRAREECSNITKSLEDDNAKMKSFHHFSLVNGLDLV
ncbi:hypothetical protein TanjilG_25389 [Lupinus angustifolius]|uniref:Phospholipase-like protein n=1 Tax=Lupinus angustifolius TaxID=3871 RepID=A0A1J7FMR4_LUPAN|nr:hypothetical protein TanjilG_25389 [Lupinus angustifolius]